MTRPVKTDVLEGSCYHLMSDDPEIHVSRWFLDSDDALQAANLVNSLLENNPRLVPTFDNNNLTDRVLEKPYLVINGIAASLSARQEAPPEAPERLRDLYFSEKIIKNPTRCPNGHYFERGKAIRWKAIKGDICPEGDHPIGNLVLDVRAQRDASRYRATIDGEEARNREIAERLKSQQDHIQELEIKQQADYLNMSNRIDTLTVSPISMGNGIGLTAKIVVKLAPSIIAEIGKLGSKHLAKFSASRAGKALPFLSLVVGFGMAAYRIGSGIKHKDRKREITAKVFLEIASGVAGCFPLLGTAVGLGIDALLITHDIHKHRKKIEAHNLAVSESSLVHAYEAFGLKKDEDPSKEEVDRAFRKASRAVHPDHLQELNEDTEFHKKSMQLLNGYRDRIYEDRGWPLPGNNLELDSFVASETSTTSDSED